MSFKTKLLPAALAACMLTLAGCSDDGSDGAQGAAGNAGAQGEAGTQGPSGEQGPAGQDASTHISLSVLGRYETGEFDESAAEIVSFDPTTAQAFVVNANSGLVDVLDMSSPATPTKASELTVAADIASAIEGIEAGDLGAANSVAVSGSTVAVAVEADVKQETGYIALYQTDGTFLTAVAAGALPDMVTFTPDGNKILAANEGEPNGDYSNDPEGSVTVIDVSAGAAMVTQTQVTQISFAEFNSDGARSAELGEMVRISSKSASVAQDLEPEYIAVSADGSKAWVALQENNALVTIDVASNTVDSIKGLGYKSYAIPGSGLDASNKDDAINIRNWPLYGVYMPDSIDSFEYNNTNFIVTANEGDGREYLTDAADETECLAGGGFEFDDGDCFHYLDEIRVGKIEGTGATIDWGNTELLYGMTAAELTDDANLGRVKVITNMGVNQECIDGSLAATGQPEAGCTYDKLYSYGARSFTIWNGETGELVFDSGSDFESITAERLGEDFNATNDENGGDDRSDDKGPEPEAIEVATIGGKTYAFIGLERVGGIMVYDITNPEASDFVQYINPRDFSVDIEALVDAGDFSTAGDLGPESIHFVSADNSPSGEPLLLVGNEVSGTTTVYQVDVITAQ